MLSSMSISFPQMVKHVPYPGEKNAWDEVTVRIAFRVGRYLFEWVWIDGAIQVNKNVFKNLCIDTKWVVGYHHWGNVIEKHLDNALRHTVRFLGSSPMWSQKLDSVILMGLFQLRVFYDYVKIKSQPGGAKTGWAFCSNT